MKKSDVNSALRTARMSPFDSRYAATRVRRASGSRGGSMGHAGTCGSSATKKLYRCRPMKTAVAGCRATISTISSPSNRPVSPRNVLTPSSCSSGRRSKCES